MRMVKGKIVLSVNEQAKDGSIYGPRKVNRHYNNQVVTNNFLSPRPYHPEIVSQEHKEYIEVEPVGERNNNRVIPLPQLPVERTYYPPVTETIMVNGKIMERVISKGMVVRRAKVQRWTGSQEKESYR